MNPDVPSQFVSLPVSAPKEAPGNRHSILELFKKLNSNNLDRLIFLLEMPIKEQPSRELSSYQRENCILEYFANIPNGLSKLESELGYLVTNQPA
jgi:hypothetical protein